MACGCSKNKGNSAAVNKVTAPTRPSRPLSEGGRIRRAEKRIIR
jgi:hypothetical protein